MNRAFAFGPFLLCPGTRTLLRDGAAISIGSRAFDILVALVIKRGTVLSHRELLRHAWPGLVVEDANLRVQIQSLRRSLRDSHKDERLIVSVAGRGYCFAAIAEEVTLPHASLASQHDPVTKQSGTRSSQASVDEYETTHPIARPGERNWKSSLHGPAQGESPRHTNSRPEQTPSDDCDRLQKDVNDLTEGLQPAFHTVH
jgi:DNA-binding winged helix-turn-helix (wHTH) protein